MSRKTLDLNNPIDARIFLKEALPQALPNKANVTEFTLQDGTTVKISELDDSQAVQYAWECLPIYQAAFASRVDVQYEH